MVEENESVGPVGAAGSSDFGSASGTWRSIPATVLPPAPPRRPAPQVGKAAPQPTTSASRPTPQQLAAAVDRANAQLASINRVVQLRVDGSTGITVASILDSQTGEVLQQTPSLGTIDLMRLLESWSKGGGGALVDLIA
ncbi:MAG TPA: flagellar protein FlaG [Steroidobacteraceae bacterium]|nr:flagellar protein FlaG [Steroidobacteraceae bacterium]